MRRPKEDFQKLNKNKNKNIYLRSIICLKNIKEAALESKLKKIEALQKRSSTSLIKSFTLQSNKSLIKIKDEEKTLQNDIKTTILNKKLSLFKRSSTTSKNRENRENELELEKFDTIHVNKEDKDTTKNIAQMKKSNVFNSIFEELDEDSDLEDGQSRKKNKKIKKNPTLSDSNIKNVKKLSLKFNRDTSIKDKENKVNSSEFKRGDRKSSLLSMDTIGKKSEQSMKVICDILIDSLKELSKLQGNYNIQETKNIRTKAFMINQSNNEEKLSQEKIETSKVNSSTIHRKNLEKYLPKFDSIKKIFTIEETLNSGIKELSQYVRYASFKYNQIIHLIGEKIEKNFLILKGLALIIGPKDFEVKMTKKQYINYLFKLKQLDQTVLFKACLQKNFHTLKITDKDFDSMLKAFLSNDYVKYTEKLLYIENNNMTNYNENNNDEIVNSKLKRQNFGKQTEYSLAYSKGMHLVKFFNEESMQFEISVKEYLKIMNSGLTDEKEFYKFVNENPIFKLNNEIVENNTLNNLNNFNIPTSIKPGDTIDIINNLNEANNSSVVNNSNKMDSELIKTLERTSQIDLNTNFSKMNLKIFDFDIYKTHRSSIENLVIKKGSRLLDKFGCISQIKPEKPPVVQIQPEDEIFKLEGFNIFKFFAGRKINFQQIVKIKLKKKLEERQRIEKEKTWELLKFYDTENFFNGVKYNFHIYKFAVTGELSSGDLIGDFSNQPGLSKSLNTIICKTESLEGLSVKTQLVKSQLNSIYEMKIKDNLNILLNCPLFKGYNKKDMTRLIYPIFHVNKDIKNNIIPSNKKYDISNQFFIVKNGTYGLYFTFTPYQIRKAINNLTFQEHKNEIEIYNELGEMKNLDNFLNKKIRICIKHYSKGEAILFDELFYLKLKLEFNKERLLNHNFNLLINENTKSYVDDLSIFSRKKCNSTIKHVEKEEFNHSINKKVFKLITGLDTDNPNFNKNLGNSYLSKIINQIEKIYYDKAISIRPFLNELQLEIDCESSHGELFSASILDLAEKNINSQCRHLIYENISEYTLQNRLYLIEKLELLYITLKDLHINNSKDQINNYFEGINNRFFKNMEDELIEEENDLIGGEEGIKNNMSIKRNHLDGDINKTDFTNKLKNSKGVYGRTSNNVIISKVLNTNYFEMKSILDVKENVIEDIDEFLSKRTLTEKEAEGVLNKLKMESKKIQIPLSKKHIYQMKEDLETLAVKEKVFKPTLTYMNKEYMEKYKHFYKVKHDLSNKLEKEINKINKNELLELIENVKKHKKTSYDFNNKLNFLNTDNLQDSLRQSESKKKLNNDTTVLNLTTNNNSYRANNLTDRQSVFESKSIKNIKSTISTNINSPSKSKLITHINENYKSNNSISNNYLNTNQENRTNTNNSKNKNNYQTFFKTVELSSNINKNTHNKFNNFTAAGKQISSDYFAKNDIPSLENFFKGFKMNYSEDRNSIISNGRRSDIGFNTNRLKHLTKSNEIKYNTNDLETPIKISKKSSLFMNHKKTQSLNLPNFMQINSEFMANKKNEIIEQESISVDENKEEISIISNEPSENRNMKLKNSVFKKSDIIKNVDKILRTSFATVFNENLMFDSIFNQISKFKGDISKIRENWEFQDPTPKTSDEEIINNKLTEMKKSIFKK